MNEKIDLMVKECLTASFPAYDKTKCGYCARAIRNAVEKGLGCTIKRTTSAKDYGPSYEKIGFKKVFEYPIQSKEEYKPEIGDISIIEYDPHGHICMFTGKKWVSDFVQNDMYGGSIRKKDPKFTIYRYQQ
jgi:hypothetical protein